MVKRSNGQFYGCTNYPHCNNTYEIKNKNDNEEFNIKEPEITLNRVHYLRDW